MRRKGIWKYLTTLTTLLLLLCLLPVTVHAMTISVKGASVEVESSDEIQAVIQKLVEAEVIDRAEGTHLVYRGKQMEQGRTLADYGVSSGAVVYIRCDTCSPDAGGVCAVCTSRYAASVTAGGTTTHYVSAAQAFEAASGGTVTILADSQLAGTWSAPANLVVNSGVTLSVNGKLELNGSLSGGGTIAGSGALTVSGGNTVSGISVSCGSFANYGVIEGGTFTAVENYGTIKGGTYHGTLVNHGTVMADYLIPGSNFAFTKADGTVTDDSHKHSTAATCTAAKTCIFCGRADGTPDPNAHRFQNHVCAICGTVQLHEAMVSLSAAEFLYNGRIQTPAITVKYGEKTLTENMDYLVSMTQGSNAGTYSVTVTAAKSTAYTGSVTKDYTITPAPIDSAVLALSGNTFTYDGAAHKPAATVTLDGFGNLKADVDYTVLYTRCASMDANQKPKKWDGPQSCIDAGTYFAVIEGKGNFRSESVYSVYAPFTIEKADITPAHFAFTLPENMVYDGRAKAVAITPAAGISGMGSVTLCFKAAPDGAYDASPVNAGTYWAAVQVADGKNFKAPSGPITSDKWKFTIQKADPVMAEPAAAALTYNGAEQKLISPGTVVKNETIYYRLGKNGTWGTAVPTAAKAGDYTVYWYAGTEGSQNYNYVSGTIKSAIKPVTITVVPDANQKKTYGEALPKLTYTVKGALKAETPAFSGALTVNAVNAGTYEIKKGTLALKDSGAFKAENYQLALEKVKFVIEKAALKVTAEDQTLIHGVPISQESYEATKTAEGDVLKITLTPSTTNITYGGLISPTASVENAQGKSVSDNYVIELVAGKLVIEPNTAAIKDLTTENVNHTASEGIKTLQNALRRADTKKASTAQKKQLEELEATCAALLERIEAAAKARETDGIRGAAGITAENVKLEDEAALRLAVADIQKAISGFGGNYTAEDKKALDDRSAQLQEALDVIENVRSVLHILSALPATIQAEDAQAAGARAAIAMLTEHEKELVGTADSGKLMEKVAYKFLSGDGGIWEGERTMTFEIDGDYTRFTGIRVDGKELDEKYYQAEPGSTVISLKRSYLRKVSSGTDHTITVCFDDGEVHGTFQVHEDAASSGSWIFGILLWATVAFASVVGLAAVYVYAKKKK